MFIDEIEKIRVHLIRKVSKELSNYLAGLAVENCVNQPEKCDLGCCVDEVAGILEVHGDLSLVHTETKSMTYLRRNMK